MDATWRCFLALCFFIFASAAIASEPTSGGELRLELGKCAATENDIERLQCYDDAFKSLAAQSDSPGESSAPPQSEQASGPGWVVKEDKDPLMDPRTWVAALLPTEGEGAFIVRCANGELDILLSWNEYLADNTTVQVRFDDDVVQQQVWLSSTDHGAIFAADRHKSWLLSSLQQAERLVARITPYQKGASDRRF